MAVVYLVNHYGRGVIFVGFDRYNPDDGPSACVWIVPGTMSAD